MSKQILDLGCGWAKVNGAIGVDRAPLATVDVVANLDSKAIFLMKYILMM